MVDEATRQMVLDRVANLVSAVRVAVPDLTAATTLDGARRHAAASMLMRSIELLEAALSIENIPAARSSIELTVRSTFEVTTRARFLLAVEAGHDEFVRMCRDADDRDSKLADKSGYAYPGLPAWLSELLPEEAKAPRNLWQICESLDMAEGRAIEDRYSARAGYQLLYSWLSNSAAHAGLSAMKRFAIEIHGTLHLIPAPEPLTTHWPVPIVAAHVGELALRVFEAFHVDDATLRALEVRLPSVQDDVQS